MKLTHSTTLAFLITAQLAQLSGLPKQVTEGPNGSRSASVAAARRTVESLEKDRKQLESERGGILARFFQPDHQQMLDKIKDELEVAKTELHNAEKAEADKAKAAAEKAAAEKAAADKAAAAAAEKAAADKAAAIKAAEKRETDHLFERGGARPSVEKSRDATREAISAHGRIS